MGLAWMATALGAINPVIRMPLVLAGVVTFAVLMTGVRRLRRAAAARPASEWSGADSNRMRRRFALVLAAESFAIAAAINILVGSGHPDWIPAAICAAVGLHFIPLARLFAVRLYDATAAGLCLVAATTLAIGAAGASESVWHLVPGLGAAAVLWATSGRLLVTSPT
jgi:hypothetical protein